MQSFLSASFIMGLVTSIIYNWQFSKAVKQLGLLKKLYMALHAAPNKGPLANANADRQPACIVSPAAPTSRRCEVAKPRSLSSRATNGIGLCVCYTCCCDSSQRTTFSGSTPALSIATSISGATKPPATENRCVDARYAPVAVGLVLNTC